MGFFRLLASEVHADVLTYAIFLAAICIAVQKPELKLLASLLWALLIPLKFIAVVFIPPAIVADFLAAGERSKLLRRYLIPVIAAAAAIAGILIFDSHFAPAHNPYDLRRRHAHVGYFDPA
jgi:hypothetical protein